MIGKEWKRELSGQTWLTIILIAATVALALVWLFLVDGKIRYWRDFAF
jgi:hypothetical protein